MGNKVYMATNVIMLKVGRGRGTKPASLMRSRGKLDLSLSHFSLTQNDFVNADCSLVGRRRVPPGKQIQG